MGLVVYFGHRYSLNRIKSKVVGDGQHGTARWATKSEIHQTYKRLLYTPNQWRKGENRPEIQGLIVGCEQRGGRTNALIDDGDVHCLMIGASGVGKTAAFLYPNIEYACAAGMSFVCTDSKGDVYRNTATIAEKYYGYSLLGYRPTQPYPVGRLQYAFSRQQVYGFVSEHRGTVV